MPSKSLAKCEYQRCGGLGTRLVAKPRPAQIRLEIGLREWKVCESCADMLLRQARQEGFEVYREPLAPIA